MRIHSGGAHPGQDEIGRATMLFGEKDAREIFLRDNFTCQYCGARGKDLTLDHVIPRHKGGRHTWDNLVSACRGVGVVTVDTVDTSGGRGGSGAGPGGRSATRAAREP
jgi:hypothetical protein